MINNDKHLNRQHGGGFVQIFLLCLIFLKVFSELVKVGKHVRNYATGESDSLYKEGEVGIDDPLYNGTKSVIEEIYQTKLDKTSQDSFHLLFGKRYIHRPHLKILRFCKISHPIGFFHLFHLLQ